MERRGHYVKRSSKCTIPGVIFALVPHSSHSHERASVGYTEHTWYCAEIAAQYRRSDGWSRVQSAWVHSPEELRAWMSVRAKSGRNNWVIAPDVMDALTLSQWWTYAERIGVHCVDRGRADGDEREDTHDRERVRIDRIVSGAGCDILEYSFGGIRWRWVSARNWWPDYSAGGCSRDGGDERAGGGRSGCADGHTRDNTSEASGLLSRVRGLCGWWRRIARAPLGCTAGQLAWGVLRSYIAPRTLTTHTDSDAMRLERASAHGGRASVWYVGHTGVGRGITDGGGSVRGPGDRCSVSGAVHHLDVTSMYPALMRDQLFPTALGARWDGISPRELLSLARDNGVIARVRVRMHAAEIPYRTDRETIYPLGEFTTVLAGPEICALPEWGEIARVYDVQEYRLGAPFREAMTALLTDRASYDPIAERDQIAFSKLVANSLAGRCAMRRGGWERCAALDEEGRWGFDTIISDAEPHPIRIRYLCGIAHRWRDDKDGAGPHTSAFAYLTSYGRVQMARIRAVCPPRSVISQDTDGLWVTDSAFQAISSAGMLARKCAGALRHTASVGSAEFYGPKHYRAGSRWVLSGYHAPLVDTSSMRAIVTTKCPLARLRSTEAPTSVHTVTRSVLIPCDLQRGTVADDGWVTPPTILPPWSSVRLGE